MRKLILLFILSFVFFLSLRIGFLVYIYTVPPTKQTALLNVRGIMINGKTINNVVDGDALLRKNATSILHISWPKRLWVWFNNVRPRGCWDYKSVKAYRREIFCVKSTLFSVRQFGNLNYGYTGHALGFPACILKLAAGFVNLVQGQRPGPWLDGLGDPPLIDIGYKCLQ
jgi:hypothetical protein